MNDEIIRELWEIKDGIAREFGYDVDALAEHFKSQKRPGNREIVDLSVKKEKLAKAASSSTS
ncbi:MAG: hypothetical protein KAW12_21260 [Candidatus Aminicenantes bacterium]|nr:hypothetical protein [Candidatus Aminicenantes bacterium]